MNRANERFKRACRQNEVSLYVPSPELVAAAQERTEGMLHAFIALPADTEWRLSLEYLQRLLNSAYLQGAQDAANVAAQMSTKGRR